MKKTIFFFLLFSFLSHSQNLELKFDKQLTYIAYENNKINQYDGFVQQYLNSKSNNYTVLLLSQWINYRGNSLFLDNNQEDIIVIENQDSIIALGKKDLFKNEFVVSFKNKRIKTKLLDVDVILENTNEKNMVNGYTCTNFRLKQKGQDVDVDLDLFCIDTNNETDNVSALMPKNLRGNTKGLIVQFQYGSFKFNLEKLQKVENKLFVNIEDAQKKYGEFINSKPDTVDNSDFSDYFEVEIDTIAYAIDTIQDELREYDKKKYKLYQSQPEFCDYIYLINQSQNNNLIILNEGFIEKQCSNSIYFLNDNMKLNEDEYYRNLNIQFDLYEKELIDSKLFDLKEIKDNMSSLKSLIEKQRKLNIKAKDNYDF